MAVRIRKLAKELGRSTVELIGVLHALGYDRYSSAEDMLPAVAEAKLRRGIKSGVAPEPVRSLTQAAMPAPAAPRKAEPAPAARSEVMARLLPGVVPIGAQARGREVPEVAIDPVQSERTPTLESAAVVRAVGEPPSSRALAVEREALDSQRRRMLSERAVLDSERAAVDEERRRVEARERGLDAEREALGALRAALESERRALDVEREVWASTAARAQASRLTCLQDVLEARGLRGSDEFERALIALATGRHLRDVLWTIRLDPEHELARVLNERLVLVGGVPPDGLAKSAAVVEVAPERAEVPGASTLERLLKEVSEKLLLHGMRRLTLVGGRPAWQRLLRERLDPRIDVRAAPGVPRTVHLAEADVVRTDAIVLWDVEQSAEARAIYAGSRAAVIVVDDPALGALFRALLTKLDA
jgi:hypothetical protein